VTRGARQIGRHGYQAMCSARDAGLATPGGLSLPSQGLLSRRTGRFTCAPGRLPQYSLMRAAQTLHERGNSARNTRRITRMPKFVIEREIAASASSAAGAEGDLAEVCGVLQAMGPKIQWVQTSSPTTRSTALCGSGRRDGARARDEGRFPARGRGACTRDRSDDREPMAARPRTRHTPTGIHNRSIQ